MKRIIINGANGYVASNFINELLKQHYEVIAFVRGNQKYSADQRMLDVMADINDGVFQQPKNLRIFNYSLLDENFGLSEQTLHELFQGDVDYYHFAASLKYDFKAKDEIFQTNMDGVENSVAVFSKYAAADSRFFFISTAYSCGKLAGRFEEKFYDVAEIDAFRNYYEQSKRYAENLIRKHIENDGLNAHILRLSQVVGNNKTGVTKTDYGIFDFSRRIQSLALRNPNLELRAKIDPESTQNLIPIDKVVSYLLQTVKIEQLPVIMNMVSKNAIRNSDILNSLHRLLPIKLVPQVELDKAEMNVYERIISIGMSFTASYTGTNIEFDTTKLDEVMEADDNEASPESIHRMIAYFLEENSDKKAKVAC
ncbi:SDR family oxidoreductase [Mangrovibacterium marinum]|uniref:Nucleoside-diphosphate-sugar epimerase n=1 Tax=Mangrovibacterium marinum TaxID=1639118 RepID=A0A2T5C3V3_9BACT|nr:SDR family oxidoreductase [Mangrovibacterium marinum]PTN09491.1 nucleoside-diphosphate-sugar epimerase [Mangrovibacterium marinum]